MNGKYLTASERAKFRREWEASYVGCGTVKSISAVFIVVALIGFASGLVVTLWLLR